jgi:hypothetical protein
VEEGEVVVDVVLALPLLSVEVLTESSQEKED